MSTDLRLPRQERSQATWNRILDSGVSLLEEAGFDGFTIAAICKRADVSPPVIYSRVNTKKTLFFAVFEHGFEPIRQQLQEALLPARWAEEPGESVVRGAIKAIVEITLAHERFLRPVIRQAEFDDEIAESTRESRAGVAARFRELVLQHPEPLRETHPDRIDACFRIVFAALLTRVTHANALDIGARITDTELAADLQQIAVRSLLK